MRPKLVPELICSDIERSVSFYIDLLGFTILYERPEDRFALLQRDGAEIMLEQSNAQDRLWPKVAFEKPYGRGVNFEVQVSNVEQLHTAVVGAGLTCFLPLEERWYRHDHLELGVRQFAVQDPDGYLIRLSQDIGVRAASARRG
ncbi:MAG: VOC family protein [Pseudomonadota bacterium]